MSAGRGRVNWKPGLRPDFPDTKGIQFIAPLEPAPKAGLRSAPGRALFIEISSGRDYLPLFCAPLSSRGRSRHRIRRPVLRNIPFPRQFVEEQMKVDETRKRQPFRGNLPNGLVGKPLLHPEPALQLVSPAHVVAGEGRKVADGSKQDIFGGLRSGSLEAGHRLNP